MGSDFSVWQMLSALVLFLLTMAEIIRRFLHPFKRWKVAVIVGCALSVWALFLRDPMSRYFFIYYWIPIFAARIIMFVSAVCAIVWTLAARKSHSKADWTAAAGAWACFLLTANICLNAGRVDFNPDR